MKTLKWTLIFIITVISCKTDNSFDYPLVFTGDVTNISESGATFTAKVTNSGKETILESGFIWSLYQHDNNGIKVTNMTTPEGIYSLNTNQTPLPGRIYYVRAYVQTNSSITFGREVSFKSPEKDFNPGKWKKVFEQQIATDWPDGCDIIKANFTIHDSTYTMFSDGKLYCYIHNSSTLVFLSETIFQDILIHFSIVYNGYAYLFVNNGFYRFNPKTLSFIKLSDLGQNQITTLASGFLNDDNIYVGIGTLKEYWKYNITYDTWQQVQSFSGESVFSSYAFSVGNICYTGSRTTSQAWIYNTDTDKWTKKVNSPFTRGEYYYIDCTSTTGNGYCFYDNYLYKYDPVFDLWVKLAQIDISQGYMCGPKIFAVGDKIYLVNIWNSDNTDHYNMWTYEE